MVRTASQNIAGASSTVAAFTPIEPKQPSKVSSDHMQVFDMLDTMFDIETCPTATISSTCSEVDAEIAAFKNEPPISSKDDPLDWWKRKQTVFPRLAACARKYLAVPASSAPVERMFSTAGLVVTAKRTRLHSSIVNDIVVLNQSQSYLKTVLEREKTKKLKSDAK